MRAVPLSSVEGCTARRELHPIDFCVCARVCLCDKCPSARAVSVYAARDLRLIFVLCSILAAAPARARNSAHAHVAASHYNRHSSSQQALAGPFSLLSLLATQYILFLLLQQQARIHLFHSFAEPAPFASSVAAGRSPHWPLSAGSLALTGSLRAERRHVRCRLARAPS
jgi:hypothetical protein